MKKRLALCLSICFVLTLWLLPHPVFALTPNACEGHAVGSTSACNNCGNDVAGVTQLVVGPASICMSAAELSTSMYSNIPEIKKTEDGVANCLTTPNISCGGATIFDTMMSKLVLATSQPGVPGKSSAGIIQSTAKMIGMLYTPPATANDYIADVMHSAGIATPAYAQGLGYASLAPVLETWKVFRTIAYFFYVVLFLIIGFMIMFRQKIGSQTVVSVQQALPKLLVSLVAVTFSYAIAGLMIEIMYIAMYLILNVFLASALGQIKIGSLGTGSTASTTGLADFGTNSNIFTVVGLLLNGGAIGKSGEAVGSMIVGALGLNSQNTGAAGSAGATALGFVTGLGAAVIFAIALMFSIFKLFFELLKTYVMIIIAIVTAPLILMMGALPGNNAFANWVKGLFFNLAVFPVILVIIVMAFLLQNNISTNGGFLPPYIGGSGTSGTVAPILGLGVLLIMPEIVQKVKGMAPKGPWDDLGNKAGAALKQGWTGGQLVPGLGFTDTSKFAGGGLSGQNLIRKGAIGAGGLLGGAVGLAEGGIRASAGQSTSGPYQMMKNRFVSNARWTGGKLGDKEIKPPAKASKTP